MERDAEVTHFVPLLQELSLAHQVYFLEGGQAVNFWAEYVSEISPSDGLRSFLPFTSDDCDIWVSKAAAAYLANRESGKLIAGKSPADGQLGIFTLPGDPPRRVDLMIGVYGIPPAEEPRLKKRALIINDVTVIDPLNLFRSKCHCFLGLDQTGRQDEKHLRMLCAILPSYLANLIATVKDKPELERPLINEIKLLRKFCKMSICRRALNKIGVYPQSLIPISEMKGRRLVLLERYAETL